MMKLYRPVGLYEMNKILDSEGKRFPPRLPEQPIFYPVLNIPYATKIAKNWNTKDSNSGFVGYVTAFEVNDKYIEKFDIQCAGGEICKELWIPSAELEEFNKKIIGNIEIIDALYGENYLGLEPIGITGFKEKIPDKQIELFKRILEYNPMDFSGTVSVEWKLLNLNYLYWKKKLDSNADILEAIQECLTKNNVLFIKDIVNGYSSIV